MTVNWEHIYCTHTHTQSHLKGAGVSVSHARDGERAEDEGRETFTNSSTRKTASTQQNRAPGINVCECVYVCVCFWWFARVFVGKYTVHTENTGIKLEPLTSFYSH